MTPDDLDAHFEAIRGAQTARDQAAALRLIIDRAAALDDTKNGPLTWAELVPVVLAEMNRLQHHANQTLDTLTGNQP